MPIILDPSENAPAAILGVPSRILQGVSATLAHSFTSDGETIDPGTATVTITASDGTTIVADAATTEISPGVFTYTVTPDQTSTLDSWTVVWTATIGDEAQRIGEVVEVVGGFVFTVAQARATTGLGGNPKVDKNNDGSYKISTARIIEARTEVERLLEHELGFAMVPRYSVGLFSGDGGTHVSLPPYVRAIRSASVDGTALTVSDLSFNPYGTLYYSAGWASGFANVTVGFEHGLSVPPPGASDVALKLARALIAGSPGDDRAASVSTEEQTTTFYVPGASEPFSIPAANRFVARNHLNVGLA